jgi:hypothetical protein
MTLCSCVHWLRGEKNQSESREIHIFPITRASSFKEFLDKKVQLELN